MEQYFFEIRNYAMEWRHHKKMNEGLKLASVKSVKTASSVCIVSLFSLCQILWSKYFFKNNDAFFNKPNLKEKNKLFV